MQLGVLLFQQMEQGLALGWFNKAWGGGNADHANRLHTHLCDGLSLVGVGDPTDLQVWSGAGITQVLHRLLSLGSWMKARSSGTRRD